MWCRRRRRRRRKQRRKRKGRKRRKKKRRRTKRKRRRRKRRRRQRRQRRQRRRRKRRRKRRRRGLHHIRWVLGLPRVRKLWNLPHKHYYHHKVRVERIQSHLEVRQRRPSYVNIQSRLSSVSLHLQLFHRV
jgi:hypothetical protein